MTPTPLARATPCLMPRPDRANTRATYSADGSAMATPVGTRTIWWGSSVTGASIQALRSMPAAPALA